MIFAVFLIGRIPGQKTAKVDAQAARSGHIRAPGLFSHNGASNGVVWELRRTTSPAEDIELVFCQKGVYVNGNRNFHLKILQPENLPD